MDPITSSKLEIDSRVTMPADELSDLATAIFEKLGCDADIARMTAEHLVEASLSGVESHGFMRVIQYAEQMESGYMSPSGRPSLYQNERGAWIVNGHDGIGIPAVQMAVDKAVELAKESGISVVAVEHCGHTGRVGAFVESGAEAGCLTICIGGGGNKNWPQVAPYGGIKGMLPTNPYAFGIPGGDRGPVVLDFATAKIAGGWIYAAKSAGVDLPADSVIDKLGNPTRNPDDYFDGGAILPMAGPKGYGLALMAEMIGEVMLGPATTEINWLLVCIDTTLYKDGATYQKLAEELLDEIRKSPPAAGFEKVEIPGEREREMESRNRPLGIAIPEKTWEQIGALAKRLGVG